MRAAAALVAAMVDEVGSGGSLDEVDEGLAVATPPVLVLLLNAGIVSGYGAEAGSARLGDVYAIRC